MSSIFEQELEKIKGQEKNYMHWPASYLHFLSKIHFKKIYNKSNKWSDVREWIQDYFQK